MKLHDVSIDDEALSAFCRERRIHHLMIFGSLTRETFRPDSDVDLVVEYEPGAGGSLLDFAGDELALTAIVKRTVHLTELCTIPDRIRDSVLRGAVPIYGK